MAELKDCRTPEEVLAWLNGTDTLPFANGTIISYRYAQQSLQAQALAHIDRIAVERALQRVLTECTKRYTGDGGHLWISEPDIRALIPTETNQKEAAL